MSTLATNKLGTLSGSADMNLPSSRPSSTEAAMLDSSGNITFGAGSTKVDYVNPLDDSIKVPVYFANFVLMDYGLGSVLAVQLTIKGI